MDGCGNPRVAWGRRQRARCIALVATIVLVAAVACRDRPPRRATIGQWIWSDRDAELFVRATTAFPALVPTVWIGTITTTRSGSVQSRLALSPGMVRRSRTAVVIRFEDEFRRALSATGPADSVAIATAVARLVTAASATGVDITEVQLDFDCPTRLLPGWAAVTRALVHGPLAGRTVWITSLVDHLRADGYGPLFRGHVAGHILQVFDTNGRMTRGYARQVARLAERQRMPFRLGVAAFERSLVDGATTEHRRWFGAESVVARSVWYRGLWIFPGGQDWQMLVEAIP